ncbi:hypothetical protein KFK09_023991 [Dendrobium nobile]|uniref:Uncharacterized protein n=1 Tax=Dendrobium nobile TaxID=94219 RepID=A0A8T3AI12_DENNO|nr:hypothetical protein KFK09_023991 [Dendrobium nobile]
MLVICTFISVVFGIILYYFNEASTLISVLLNCVLGSLEREAPVIERKTSFLLKFPIFSEMAGDFQRHSPAIIPSSLLPPPQILSTRSPLIIKDESDCSKVIAARVEENLSRKGT